MTTLEPEPERREPSHARLPEWLRPALLAVALLTVLTGVVFPLVLTVLARAFFPRQAAGSLLARDGAVVGSRLIGQAFSGPGYFHPRPSAAGAGHDGLASGGTNLGPASAKLRDGDEGFVGVRRLAEAYRRDNGLAPGASVPIDAVTRSGSGLDPHISPANAELQVLRVARERRLSEDAVRRLVAENTQGPDLGFLGQRRVEVLSLNLALDRLAPRSAPAR
jgi:K+-transporting ATPase ATPase C chain